MRIVKLTPAVERNLLRVRHERDAEAKRIAARIVSDVRKRGDAALFAWVKKLDGVDLKRTGVWISRREMAAAAKRANRNFLLAVKHTALNVRLVAEKQLLSTADFVKCISVQSIGRVGFERLAKDVQTLARSEGLLAHAKALEVRR